MEQSLSQVIANGQTIAAKVPCTLQDLLIDHRFLPRSVVVEHNGEAVAPSEFAQRIVRGGDRLEIIRIVAGG
jgi:thiamine biosynthesis protein ThiS